MLSYNIFSQSTGEFILIRKQTEQIKKNIGSIDRLIRIVAGTGIFPWVLSTLKQIGANLGSSRYGPDRLVFAMLSAWYFNM